MTPHSASYPRSSLSFLCIFIHLPVCHPRPHSPTMRPRVCFTNDVSCYIREQIITIAAHMRFKRLLLPLMGFSLPPLRHTRQEHQRRGPRLSFVVRATRQEAHSPGVHYLGASRGHTHPHKGWPIVTSGLCQHYSRRGRESLTKGEGEVTYRQCVCCLV